VITGAPSGQEKVPAVPPIPLTTTSSPTRASGSASWASALQTRLALHDFEHRRDQLVSL